VLQGFYQGNEATAAAVQVNNLVLVRGMIGKPGCGVIQSNGQPTAQNTRETGCNGDFPAFRNWQNPRHIEDLARVWNVEPKTIPAWAPSTHALQIFRLAETGAIKFLWIIATNPAVSLPELHRIRRILQQQRHIHQLRPHRAYLPQGHRTARRSSTGYGHLSRFRAPYGLPR
jgi:anaerobic selenocysteine-containing dehydrogenase